MAAISLIEFDISNNLNATLLIEFYRSVDDFDRFFTFGRMTAGGGNGVLEGYNSCHSVRERDLQEVLG
jgi:hypothetical protein